MEQYRPKRRKPTTVTVEPKESEKDTGEVFPVYGDDGVVRWYRSKTGAPVDSPLDTRHYRPYNAHDAELIGQCLARGMTIKNALKELKIPYGTYLRWRRDKPEFVSIVENGRRMRSEATHEEFYGEMVSTPVGVTASKDINEMDESELKEHAARNDVALAVLKTMEKKQGILQKFMKDDAPNRFGVQKQVIETHSTGSLKLGYDVDPALAKLLTERFRPRLESDGNLTVKGITDNAEDDTKES